MQELRLNEIKGVAGGKCVCINDAGHAYVPVSVPDAQQCRKSCCETLNGFGYKGVIIAYNFDDAGWQMCKGQKQKITVRSVHNPYIGSGGRVGNCPHCQ